MAQTPAQKKAAGLKAEASRILALEQKKTEALEAKILALETEAEEKEALRKANIEETEVVSKASHNPSTPVENTQPKDWDLKDRTYVLCTRKTPIMMTIPVRHTAKRPLLWFDPEKGHQRELRYATNQKSPFVDEQEGHVTLAHVAIRNGSLFVPRNQQNLQRLLSLYHPLKNIIFKEVDDVKVAVNELDVMDLELEALNAAAAMDIDLAEAIMRVEIGNKVSTLTSKELRRDLRLLAKRAPATFLELANDDNIEVRNIGIKAVEAGILVLASDQRTFTWKATGRKIMTVPFDENPYSALAAFFKTDDGIEIFQSIEKRLG